MRKIGKGYSLKIIVLMLGIAFLCNNILYSCPVDGDALRVPSIFQNSKAASKLAEASEALSIIADCLRAGEIVIVGDMHRGEQMPQDDEIWDRELFLNYVEQLGELSMNFSVALELPHQLEDKLNDPSVSVEDFLDEYYKLLSAKNSVELARADREIRGPYLLRLLSTLKRFNIPVILIDDINSQRRGGLGTDIDVIEQSNRDMAQKLLEGRKKYSNDPVLLRVGRNHVVPKISSIWLGGRGMNSIPGVLRELGARVKLVRPDDFKYDKEDLAKFDLIIKVEGNLASGENLADLSVDQLILQAELSMLQHDWPRFNKIVEELKGRKDIQVIVVAGPKFINKEVNIDSRLLKRVDQREAKKHLSKVNFEYDDFDDSFLRHTLDNIYQHVKDGVALVVKQIEMLETGATYSEVSVIDNGTGFIDKEGNKVSIERAFTHGESPGRGKGEGLGLPVTLTFTDILAVHIPGSSEIKKYSKPTAWENKKSSGTTIVGYFFIKATDSDVIAIKNKVVEKANQYVKYLDEFSQSSITDKFPSEDTLTGI
ncbi:MAG: ATP-binding protein [Candidatus Gorgyraea atricola]|nr:ATP-binding protein [Candidatus Gorgyraea atricola]